MKTVSTMALAFGVLFGSNSFASAAETDNSYFDKVLSMQPDVTSEELLSSVNEISINTGESKDAIFEKIYQELKSDQDKGIKESKSLKVTIPEKGQSTNLEGDEILGGSGGTVSVGSSTKGNFYYTPSQTAYLNHGHVGMYYSSTTIVESVPSDGVRTISTTKRKVDSSGAVVKSVDTTTAKRTAAADWAYSQLGESYSYNFATNRSTSHTGAKNCSKLIWSAYKLKASLDLDVDGGLGVYPRDVRDASATTKVRNI
ncbi:YiiX/YebB-like N1pC/P60 family cysteine hydrolase [Rummeliibacillus stabekisii]|uniref:YiiX/YebB-like N1pC/P60 family cysteine hydrolase n=1 Tax=Rummeliibacillus stabekisii TaxID=241244 RepID=UPI0011BEE723|nr:YiiX/YebB-like N1pC/P60 family cysteine hydrolase [Rummeliibacillus stabekisii]